MKWNTIKTTFFGALLALALVVLAGVCGGTSSSASAPQQEEQTPAYPSRNPLRPPRFVEWSP